MKHHFAEAAMRTVPVTLIALLAFVAQAEETLECKVYPNDVVNIQRWHLTEYNPEVQNVQCASSGQLPSGISDVVERTPTGYGAEWYGYLRGTVAAQGAVQLERCTHSVMVTYGVMSETPSVTNVYPSLMRVDDYADEPGDTNHQAVLSIQTSWSESEGYTVGSLYPESVSGGVTQEVVDTDVLRLDAGPGVYCIETRCTQSGSPALDIAVLKKMTDENAYDGEAIAWTNDFNVYDPQGQPDGLRQRVYCTLDNHNGAFVRLTPSDPDEAVNYRIRVFRARPVILVHGINAPPTQSGPNNPEDCKTSFGDTRDYLGYFAEISPCVCYDFPWWSNHPDQRGFLNYVGEDKLDTVRLHGFLYKKVNIHNGYEADIILHSMGGFVVRHSLAYGPFADLVHRVVFIDSPQYGSDLANFLDRNPGLNDLVNILPTLDTSNENILHLCRGGNTVWNMHALDLNIPAHHLSFVIGTDKGPYKHLVALMPYIDIWWPKGSGNMYQSGLHDSDGIVPVTSQNLRSREPSIPDENVIEMPKCHTGVQAMERKNMGATRPLYNLIKQEMNAE